jgi:hypothetical protein
MSNASKPFDFSQFVPGFDFLKNLAGGARPARAPGRCRAFRAWRAGWRPR